MNGNLIDTNVIIKLLNGDEKTEKVFDSLNYICISAITAGELFYGAFKSSRINENMNLFISFLSEYPVLEIDFEVGKVYGDLKFQLYKKGVNLPENDLWIASTAVKNNLQLFTYDEHFSNIPGLTLLKY